MNRLLPAAFVLLVSTSASASPLPITVVGLDVNLSLSTDVHSIVYDPVCCGTSPALDHQEDGASTHTASSLTLSATPLVSATASADGLTLSAATKAHADFSANETSTFALATAQSDLTFMPGTSGLASIGLDWTADGGQSIFSSGLISLTDLTAATSLFSYSWTYPFEGNVPWTCCYNASVVADQWLDFSHTYRLTMIGSTNANTDEQAIAMHVSGLEIHNVPEPSVLLLTISGAAVAWETHRRRRAVMVGSA